MKFAMMRRSEIAKVTAFVCGISALCGAWAMTPGSLRATDPARNGDMTVEVTVDASAIRDVKVVKHSETPGIGSLATEGMPGEMVAHQSVLVDSISGATITSDALRKGVEAALAKAGAGAGEVHKKVEA